MNEQLQQSLQKLLDKALQAGDFVIDQAPDVLQEFYRWVIVKNALEIIFGLAIIWAGRMIARSIGKKDNTSNDLTYRRFDRWYNDDNVFGAMTVFSIACFIGSIVAITSIYHIVYVVVAPKMYLIDYFL